MGRARPHGVRLPMSAPLCPQETAPGLLSPQGSLPPPAEREGSAISEPAPETPLRGFDSGVLRAARPDNSSLWDQGDQDVHCTYVRGQLSADLHPEALTAEHERQLSALREHHRMQMEELLRQQQQQQLQHVHGCPWMANPQVATPMGPAPAQYFGSPELPYEMPHEMPQCADSLSRSEPVAHQQWSPGPSSSPYPSSDPTAEASPHGTWYPSRQHSPSGSHRSASRGSGDTHPAECTPPGAHLEQAPTSGQCAALCPAPPAPEMEHDGRDPEQLLADLVEAALADTSTNPFHGSLAMAVVQCNVSAQAPRAYEAVVGKKYSRSFHSFIGCHAQFRIFHYDAEVVGKWGLHHCSSDGARVCTSAKSNMDLAIADQQTACWREQRQEEAVCLMEAFLRERPMHMRALMQRFQQADTEGRFKGVLPSNHAFRKLVRDRPARIVTTPSTLLKVPEQLSAEERGMMLARSRAAEQRGLRRGHH
eukprot:TRINITY_DN7_c4_g1_i1.p1 TRINITY_DN7_c4_g1~~TRINITY_DN7_c4_g1_i1.p1  ORF type:complete len:504 (+),score=163.20 TRINITY_DN7_c4_g1_i1:77-1513(+)